MACANHVRLSLFTNVCSVRKALENRANMEDDRTAVLESQLHQAKQIAEEADKKYEEVRANNNNNNNNSNNNVSRGWKVI
jgi:hypothetical protein